jgi:hypothetical protein
MGLRDSPAPPFGGDRYNERMTTMCLDCGCGEPNERHGDDRHIVMDDVRAAAEASEIPVEAAARNIADGLHQAQRAGTSSS